MPPDLKNLGYGPVPAQGKAAVVSRRGRPVGLQLDSGDRVWQHFLKPPAPPTPPASNLTGSRRHLWGLTGSLGSGSGGNSTPLMDFIVRSPQGSDGCLEVSQCRRCDFAREHLGRVKCGTPLPE
ncbi:UNVERIFIED_CONTAM: hypothetical protein K2H54_029602 [Gekko kuhli]